MVKALACINVWNQYQINEIASILTFLDIKEWGLSWITPAGRAIKNYTNLIPQEDVIRNEIIQVVKRYPDLKIKYSNYGQKLSKYYFLILPDGTIATEDVVIGKKINLGKLPQTDILDLWNNTNFNLSQHFQKWIGNRYKYI